MSRGDGEDRLVYLHGQLVPPRELEISLAGHHFVCAAERDGQHGQLQAVGYHERPSLELPQFAGV